MFLAELVENVGSVKSGVFAQLPGDGLEGLGRGWGRVLVRVSCQQCSLRLETADWENDRRIHTLAYAAMSSCCLPATVRE